MVPLGRSVATIATAQIAGAELQNAEHFLDLLFDRPSGWNHAIDEGIGDRRSATGDLHRTGHREAAQNTHRPPHMSWTSTTGTPENPAPTAQADRRSP